MMRMLRAVLVAALVGGLLPATVLAADGPGFDQQPGGGAPGVVWSQQPRVAIKTGNNINESATGTITLTITGGTGTAGALLACTTNTVPLSNGIASFSGCRIDKAGTGYRLTATWNQGGSDESAPFNITGATGTTGTKLGFVVQAARGTPTTALAVQPSVAIQDAAGTTVTAAAPVSITLALGTNPGGGILTCTGGLSKTTVNGVAAFTGCRVDKVGVGYTLTATATSLTSATSALFDVADRLAFTTQPAGASTGVAFTTQPVVAVRAGASATATHDSATVVNLAIQAGTGAPGAVLTCTGGLSKTAVNGLASFVGCAISKPGVGYVLFASSNGLTSAVATPFNVVQSANLSITSSQTVITWGSQILITLHIDQSGTTRQVAVQGTRDGSNWTTIVTLVTDASGNASFLYHPVTNLYYRAVFAGAADLGAMTSSTVRTVVRQISVLRSLNRGFVLRIARGTSITFTDTVRPARPELPPATVRFVFYRRGSDGAWRLYDQRDLVINALGKAVTSWNFPVTGEWYVRSQARPTPYNANSVWGPLQRFSVR
jgi:hypothetical protein